MKDEPVRLVGSIFSHDGKATEEYIEEIEKKYKGKVFRCPFTLKSLFFEKEDGGIIYLDSFGECYNCGLTVHRDKLKMHEGVSKESYPIVYQGCWCKECWDLPESQWRDNIESQRLDQRFDDELY